MSTQGRTTRASLSIKNPSFRAGTLLPRFLCSRALWNVILFAALASCGGNSSTLDPGAAPIWGAADELREPQVFSSVDGVLDLLVIAKPAVITQFAPYQPTGWVYEICPRPTDGTTQCPDAGATGNLYGGSRLQINPGDMLKIRL